MKPFNIFLSLIVILLLAFVAFFFAGGTLMADVSSISANAADHPEAFEAVREVIANGSAPQIFTTEVHDDAGQYLLKDISVTLSNRGIFDAEWLNISVEGVPGDVAVYSLSGNGTDVPARLSGQLNLKLLTTAPADVQRTISIQYYVYGISRTITVTA